MILAISRASTAKEPPLTASQIVEAVLKTPEPYKTAEDHEIWEKSRLLLDSPAEILDLLSVLCGEGENYPEAPVYTDGTVFMLTEAGKAAAEQMDSDWRQYCGKRLAEKPAGIRAL
ncbi:hypothetical protein SEA_GODONK_227 [Gordonia phage GodonK]|uniref:Uncharacterized protein n=1 Tax=Gordonia phage GodonK TaxID=2562192 RepID=A0A4D6E4D2_9CAUD|nr:hypothetical protein HOV33_gp001 [Gordonia phage GodonK]YP_009821580.1 hypothetical protein HOV33_gp141 [Gordonia phage GodonK]QBZ72620.1 hypothetical protein SEA_GODONK_1 [Gordonia phage GodonK]QBZ72815.1 hypothetical protein SEA_GODONK_227 [Gordonia phage GodonK]